eukprot:scaffold109_cov252-Pinguiococcus_pyrenoidosus.AAC.78
MYRMLPRSEDTCKVLTMASQPRYVASSSSDMLTSRSVHLAETLRKSPPLTSRTRRTSSQTLRGAVSLGSEEVPAGKSAETLRSAALCGADWSGVRAAKRTPTKEDFGRILKEQDLLRFSNEQSG